MKRMKPGKVYFDEFVAIRPQVTMKNWSMVIDHPFQAPEVQVPKLQGNAYGHPRFEDGDPVTTSPIIGIEDHGDYKLVHTRNTVYKVAAADVDPEYEKLYPGAYQRLSAKRGSRK